MKVEFVEPFVKAAFSVFESVTKTKPTRGQISLRPASFTTQPVTIVAGVNGGIEGTVLYGMSPITAQKVASAMMDTESNSLDEMALSAISELGNMITGNAATLMSENGYDVKITPPSIVRGKDVEVSTNPPALVVYVNTQFGRVDINVALEEKAVRKAA